ncbi:auxin response factor 18-like [Populus alba x Populus x berolinensis]|nr:auxin response factor 18-like [Populus alba x Populus x berolinensis]
MKETEMKSLDPQLWQACAGSMVHIPPLNSIVFYFPQGHAEHSQSPVNFPQRIPSLIPCRVATVKFLADPDTDEVYAKIGFVPLPNTDLDFAHDRELCGNGNDSDSCPDKPASFAKTLTQSDANNGGGFSVPRYCAETIFPRLDYTSDPPLQTVIAKDVHGEVWKFRHIYRGTPRRHLLTTGWSTFVNQKKLVAGDSIVFLRAENGDLRVGIRRSKRGIGIGSGPESSLTTGWNSNNATCAIPYDGFSLFVKEDEMRNGGMKGRGRVKPEEVLEAADLAANGKPFQVVYYPRSSTPEFCVKASSVRAAMRIGWCSGMRFKMAFETEDSSRISWFMGTVTSAQVADPVRWPNSPWRLLQVAWDEPDLLQNVKRVSPWLVELVSNMPVIHLSPFSPPRKKSRFPQQLDFPLDLQFRLPSFSGNPLGPSSPLCCLSDNTPAGIQGARHAQFGISLSDIQFNNKLQSGMFLSNLQRFNPRSRNSETYLTGHTNSNENISCLLTMGNSNQNLEKSDNVKKHQFLLFGQPIVIEQHISHSCSADAVSQDINERNSSDESSNKEKISDVLLSAHGKKIPQVKSCGTGFSWHQSLHNTSEIGKDTGPCKVFLESEDVGWTLDLSALCSYEELHGKLANMFGIERSDMSSHVLYRDATGAVKQIGDEPFSVFMKTAKRLTVLMNRASTESWEDMDHRDAKC